MSTFLGSLSIACRSGTKAGLSLSLEGGVESEQLEKVEGRVEGRVIEINSLPLLPCKPLYRGSALRK
jgi:hypothetical protein